MVPSATLAGASGLHSSSLTLMDILAENGFVVASESLIDSGNALTNKQNT